MSSARINFKTLLADGPAIAPRRNLAWEGRRFAADDPA